MIKEYEISMARGYILSRGIAPQPMGHHHGEAILAPLNLPAQRNRIPPLLAGNQGLRLDLLGQHGEADGDEQPEEAGAVCSAGDGAKGEGRGCGEVWKPMGSVEHVSYT